MKTIKHLSLLLTMTFIAAIMTVSCTKVKPKEYSVIPKDAQLVANINIGTISMKGDLGNIKELKSVKETFDELKDEEPEIGEIIEKVLSDPTATGIDIRKDIIVFVKDVAGDEVISVTASLTNAKDFEKFLSDAMKEDNIDEALGITRDKDSGISQTFIQGVMFAYDNNRIIITAGEAKKWRIEEYTTSLFNLKDEDCIASDKTFGEYWKQRGDISAYVKYDNVMNSNYMMKEAFNDMPQEYIDEIKDMAIYYTLSFEKGCIEMKLNTIGTPAYMKNFGDHSFNSDLLNYMPATTYMAGSLVFNVNNIISLFDRFYKDDNPLNEEIDIEDYTIKDLLKAFGGSMVASAYGVTDGIPAMAMAFDFNNKKLANLITEEMGLDKDGDIYTAEYDKLINIYYKNDVIVVATDKKMLIEAANGNYRNGLYDIAGKIKKGNYFYLELNADKFDEPLIEFLDNEMFLDYTYNYDTYEFEYQLDEESRELFYEVLSYFDNVEMFVDDGTILRINTSDKNTNSLAYLIKRLDELYYKTMY